MTLIDPPENHGWAHFTPVYLPFTSLRTPPEVYGVVGNVYTVGFVGTEESLGDAIVIGHDTTILTDTPISKTIMEAWHTERYRRDSLERSGKAPFSDFIPSLKDPPDFVGQLDDAERAIECTQLADESRRTASGLFRRLKAKVEEAGIALSHLNGLAVYVSYYNGDQFALPFRPTDNANRELVEALKAFHPKIDQLAIRPGPMPQQAPDIDLVRLPTGATVHAAPLNPGYLPSRFMQETGFELVHATSSTHTAAQLVAQLHDAIEAKDLPSNQVLIITSGGPTLDGVAYPSEELLARFTLEQLQGQPVQTKHLDSVILHFWGSGETWRLDGTPTQVVAPSEPNSLLRWAQMVVPPWAYALNDPCPCGSAKRLRDCHGK